MNCQRRKANEARYRVYTDVINLMVCVSCAIKARELGIGVEVLPRLRTDHQTGVILPNCTGPESIPDASSPEDGFVL